MKLIKIGTSNKNDIVIDGDNTVSRQHLQIFIDDESNVFVTDLNSMNGTFVNGEIIKEPVLLKPYDILKIGNTLINWKAYLADNVSTNDAYKTIVDEDDEQIDYKNYDPFSDDYVSPKKRKNTVFLWFSIMILFVVGVGLYFYLDYNKNSINGTWISADNKAYVYTFNSDKTFIRDSAGIAATGTYKYLDDKTIKLKFDDFVASNYDSLILAGNETFKYPYDGDIRDEYFGGVFEFLNMSELPIKILDFLPANYDASDDVKIYLSKEIYSKPAIRWQQDDWWYYTKDTLLELICDTKNGIDLDLIIKPGETADLYVLSNNSALLSYDSSFYEHDKFYLSEFNKAQTYEGDIFYNDYQPLWWNGDIIYADMKKEFEYRCRVDEDRMKLNGIKFNRD